MFLVRSAKRPRLGETLDAHSSSSDDDDEEAAAVTFYTHPHVDQVPLLLVLGHWPDRSETMREQLGATLGHAHAQAVMNVVECVAPCPVDGEAVYHAFLQYAELGLAYLVLFAHRHDHYREHLGRRWTRKSVGVRLEHVAHAEPRVCMSNPSGITGAPLRYAQAMNMRFLDLGVGSGSYLRSIPPNTRAGGFELNANPLLLQQVLTNILKHCPRFCFVPLSFASPHCVLPENDSYVLFSWRPGSNCMPTVPTHVQAACFIKGVTFVNMHSQGFTMQDSDRSVAFYTNFQPTCMPNWSAEAEEETTGGLLQALQTFDVVKSVGNDTRKLRAAAKSLGLPSGVGADCIRQHVASMPAIEYADWLVNTWRWKLVRVFILKHCDMTTRMLLSCGVPQHECRRRLMQHLRQSPG